MNSSYWLTNRDLGNGSFDIAATEFVLRTWHKFSNVASAIGGIGLIKVAQTIVCLDS
jgi:hypothetical protein